MSAPQTYDRLPTAAPGGGFLITDEQAISEQRGVVWELIKQLGKTITDGGSLTSIAMPVNISEARSYLERLCDGWCYAPFFLTKASNEVDPIERLKWVVTFAISGLSNTCAPKKPFNPILGETFEATYDDGTQVFCEQSSHHPPITNWEMIGPGKNYHFYGHGEWSASFRGNSVRGRQLGAHIIEFPDGGKIEYHLPDVWVRGVMLGDRIVEYDGEIIFKDAKNNLSARLQFNPDSGGWFWSAKVPTDHFRGGIYKNADGNADPKQLACPLTGTWMGCVDFNGKKYWSHKDNLPVFVPTPVEEPLPSDCRYREDIIYLKTQDLAAAADWKKRLEEKQRAEARLRTAYAKKMGFEPREH